MSLSAVLAAIVLNKTICLPSIPVGSNAAYEALYEVQFCWANQSNPKGGQDNTLIVVLTAVFD
jgi:hypothetical protein